MDTCGDMFWGTAGGEARGWEGALLPFIGTHSPVGKKVNNEYIAKYPISGQTSDEYQVQCPNLTVIQEQTSNRCIGTHKNV